MIHMYVVVSVCSGSEMCPTKRTTDGHTSKRCAMSRSLQRNFRGETPLHLAAIKVRLINPWHMHVLTCIYVCQCVCSTISQKQ